MPAHAGLAARLLVIRGHVGREGHHRRKEQAPLSGMRDERPGGAAATEHRHVAVEHDRIVEEGCAQAAEVECGRGGPLRLRTLASGCGQLVHPTMRGWSAVSEPCPQLRG